MSFEDKEHAVRHDVRIAWWQEGCSTYKMAAHGPPSLMDAIPDTPLNSEWPVFAYRGETALRSAHFSWVGAA